MVSLADGVGSMATCRRRMSELKAQISHSLYHCSTMIKTFSSILILILIFFIFMFESQQDAQVWANLGILYLKHDKIKVLSP